MQEELFPERRPFLSLSLLALGIVFGDIGTSPLYAMKVSLDSLPINLVNILGVLSLIFWSLTLLISIKYLFVLFRVDNEGEGGILALLALIKPKKKYYSGLFFMIGILGAGLMLGDGMLTPAISIISAVEGVEVIFPSLADWIVPVTCCIVVVLFAVQSYGSSAIGGVFGPILLIWFLVIAYLGLVQIIQNPVVLKAINPVHAYYFFQATGFKGFLLLGGVFLVMTGGEALYADLGHFGKFPIRFSWFFLVFPALVINYFGQGAFLLSHPEAIQNPFYYLAPQSFQVFLLILATIATVIASQAVISATFSLTKQAVLLGFYPHLPIIQTNSDQRGQVYVPQMNLLLGIGTLLLILIFKNSNSMTHAYGLAVNLVMILTSILAAYFAIQRWRWHWLKVFGLFCIFGLLDLTYLAVNLFKVKTGGWIPVLFAFLAGVIMYTWSKGRRYLQETYYVNDTELTEIMNQLDRLALPKSLQSQAVFITDLYDKSGGSFMQFLRLSRMIPEKIILLKYEVFGTPHVSSIKRFQVRELKPNICELTLNYGFLDVISIPQALYVANDRGLLPFGIDVELIHYILDIPNVMPSKEKRAMRFFWQDKLFAFLVRNYSANLNIEFYQLPYHRTIAMGTYYLI